MAWWCSTGFSWADEGYLADERVLRRHQENPEVAVLTPRQEILIDAAFVVRIRWVSWMGA